MTDYDSDTTTDAETSTTSIQISIVANTKKRSGPACGGTDHLRQYSLKCKKYVPRKPKKKSKKNETENEETDNVAIDNNVRNLRSMTIINDDNSDTISILTGVTIQSLHFF